LSPGGCRTLDGVLAAGLPHTLHTVFRRIPHEPGVNPLARHVQCIHQPRSTPCAPSSPTSPSS
jgi:hypothetical protein